MNYSICKKGLIFSFVITGIFFQNQSFSIVEQNEKKETIAENKSDVKETDQNTSVSESYIDSLWEKRETVQGNDDILTLVSSKLTVPKHFNTAWKIARLVYYTGNFGNGAKLSNDEKVSLFKFGYETALIARELDPKKVEGHYWYAINLGSYGLVKGIFSALKSAKPGRDALLEAAKIDPTYHWGGPYRVLGRYYQEVPGGIISFGDKEIAEEYFNKAIKMAPDYRLNTIYLGILKKKTGNKKEAQLLFEKAKSLPVSDGTYEENKYAKELNENLKSLLKE